MTKSNNPIRMATGATLCASLALLAAGCATRSHTQAPISYGSESSPPMVVVGTGPAASGAIAPPGVGTPGPAATAQVGAGAGEPTVEAGATTAGPQTERVVIPLHQEQLQVGTRDVNAGAVSLRKVVKTETASQPVTLRREELVIERVPAGQAQAAPNNAGQQVVDLNQPFTEQSITIPLRQQEPVVQTQVVQKGAVVAQKNVASQTTTVQHPVRDETIQIVQSGQPQNIRIAPDLSGSVVSSAGQPAPNNIAQAPPAATPGQSVGTAPAYQAGTAGAAAGGPITSLQTLASTPDPATLAGRSVQFADATVQRVIGDHLIALQGPNNTTVFVQTQQPVAGIKAGDVVTLRGEIQPVPQTIAQDLGAAAAQALQGQPILIQTTSLQKAGAVNP